MQAREETTVNALAQPGHRFLASPNFAPLSQKFLIDSPAEFLQRTGDSSTAPTTGTQDIDALNTPEKGTERQ
jgi:hypothetical protein